MCFIIRKALQWVKEWSLACSSFHVLCHNLCYVRRSPSGLHCDLLAIVEVFA